MRAKRLIAQALTSHALWQHEQSRKLDPTAEDLRIGSAEYSGLNDCGWIASSAVQAISVAGLADPLQSGVLLLRRRPAQQNQVDMITGAESSTNTDHYSSSDVTSSLRSILVWSSSFGGCVVCDRSTSEVSLTSSAYHPSFVLCTDRYLLMHRSVSLIGTD